MNRMKIVFTDTKTVTSGDSTLLDRFKDFGEVVMFDNLDSSLVACHANDADILVCNKTVITAKDMDALPQLKYIGVLATGYNVVDVEAARLKEIVVTNIGNVTLENVEVDEGLEGATLVEGEVNPIPSIAPGLNATVKYEYIVDEDDIKAGKVVNTATATVEGEDPTNPENPTEVPTAEVDKTIELIRNELNNWTSPIIIITAHVSLYYDVYKQRLQILDFIGKCENIKKNLSENIDICLI